MLPSDLLGNEDVGGLYVPMNESAGVRGVERGRDLANKGERTLGIELRLACEQCAEIGPLDVTHGDVKTLVRLARVVHGHDIGVIEAGSELGLDEEALAEAAVLRLLRRDQLESDRPSEPRVEGPVDDSHPAVPENGLDLVAGEPIARLKLTRNSRCQSVRVGRRVREGNLPGRTVPASGSFRIHAREHRRPR